MRALTEANVNRGIDILTQNEFDTLTSRTSTTLYIIGTIAAGELTVSSAYVGNIEQDVLVNNAGDIVWMRDTFIVADKHVADDDITASFTNAAIPLAELV